MFEIVETRVISLSDGAVLTVDMTALFFEEIRKKFMLSHDQPVTDDHVRMFVYGTVDGALKKHEEEK